MKRKPIPQKLVWVNPWDGRSIELRITHQPNYLGQGTDHLIIESVNPPKASNPLTPTGYLSHFVRPDELRRAGGPVLFVKNWMSRYALSKDWKKADAARRQGDLFQWADAQAELGKPRKNPKQKPDGKTARHNAKTRSRAKPPARKPRAPG